MCIQIGHRRRKCGGRISAFISNKTSIYVTDEDISKAYFYLFGYPVFPCPYILFFILTIIIKYISVLIPLKYVYYY